VPVGSNGGNGVVVNQKQPTPSPPPPPKEKVDVEVHALRGFKLPDRRCLLALALVEHLRNPLPTSRLDIRSLKIRCRLYEEKKEEGEKIEEPATTRKLKRLL
jgi:hypothetical protein